MKLEYSGNVMPFQDSMKKVSAISWAPNGRKFAVGAADRVVYIFDESGAKKDKFPTKPSDKGQKSYLIRSLQFSPDSQKVAVAQSDNIVFVYKIGVEWGEKKAICNKFPATTSVTCMSWPKDRHNEIIFGLADGKVRQGVLKTNKSNALYAADTYCISMSSSRDGNTVISGHLDGSVYAYSMDNQSFKKLFTHHSVPYALGFGENIFAAGNDKKVTVYDTYGNVMQRFDYAHEEKVKDFTVASFNPSGDTVALGNFNRFYVYNLNSKRGQWEENACKTIENYYTVTSIAWGDGGSKLTTGNLCGSVDIYNASCKVGREGKYLLNYVSPSQCLIQAEGSSTKTSLKSNNGLEITKIKFYNDRYAVGTTFETLIIVDMETGKSSELYWKGAGNEKFDFSSPNLCMVSNAGEITLIEYGRNEPLGTCRTQYMKANLISARISEGTKIIAYLLDLQTISLFDLNTSSIVSQISHDSKIDYLELNANANKLLFKDKRKQLYIYNLKTLTKNTLLPYCTFAKWVPLSEVVVAQNRQNLNVWYSIDNPEKVTIYSIKGDVQSIERKNGKTEVLVSDSTGNAVSSYALNEALIDFGFALQAKDLQRAAGILDSSELNNETQANWKSLAKMALQSQNVYVAEHCYGALGDVAKAAYLRKKVIEPMEEYQKESGRTDGISYYKVQAKLAILEKQFHRAEAIYLENNQIQEAMEMYQDLHKWDQTIKIAEKKNHPDVEELKKNYYSWLLETGQEERAAEIKEEEGDYNTAIQLFLKGGIPARAANVVYNSNVSFPQDLLQKIAGNLASAGMHQKAGELYEEMDLLQKALDCYVKGNAYKKAVDLAKSAEPRLVASLEERWGNYLLSIKQTQAAINHFIEADKIQKAIEASILAREWNKAIQLLSHQTPEIARPYYRQIAKHFATVRQYDFAEKYYLKAALPVDAFQMYAQVGKWELALRLAKQNLPESEINNLYVKQAKKFEEEQKWKEAEKMYLIVEEYDMAIAMYKKCAQYDHMIRLVSKYRSTLLKETHLAVAQKLHKDGNYKLAEQHYISAGAWRAAVQMYKTQGLWEEAVRCSKLYGKEDFTCELAKRWAETLGPEQGMKMLLKMNLVDAVVEYLAQKGEFDQAFKMANLHAKHKIRDVHLKHAFKLQDEKRYKEAESQFVKAGKALEAISMYENIGDFHSALQVAGQYEPQARDGILINQAKSFIENNKRQYPKAEQAYINARKPELAIKMYLDIGNTQQALRVARKHAPHLVEQIMRRQSSQPGGGSQSPEQRLQQAKTWDDTRNYSKAIEGYLQITAEDFKDAQLLQQIWRRAVQLAVTYEKDKAIKVVKVVCGRLCQIRCFDSAGQLLEQINLFEEAVGTYCEGGNFDAARQCAKMIKNPDLHGKLMDYIEKNQREVIKQDKNGWEAIKRGDYETGCQIFKDSGDWKNCLDKAHEKSPELLNKYMNQYIKITVEAGNFASAAQAYSQYGMQLIPKNYPTYKMLTLQIFVECEQKEIEPLRQALYEFYGLLEGTNEAGSPTLLEYQNYLTIAHLSNLKFIYSAKPAAQQLYKKTTVSLLRYCQFIRLDKLFYEAGMSCQKANEFGLASVFLNRYLDINEIIEDPDNNNISEEDEFRITDIPSPYNVSMPMKNMINEAEKEKIKDWLLQVNMNQKFDSSLPVKACEKCKTQIYDASISCYKCHNRNEVCILTGYPVNGSNGKQCKSCGKWGLKDAWGPYLSCFTNCPWCNKQP